MVNYINKLCFCLTQCICLRRWFRSLRPKKYRQDPMDTDQQIELDDMV